MAPEIPLEETGSRLTVDLAALKTNYRTLARHAGAAETAAVVKADAYGLGAHMVAPALWQAGARTFFVAHLTEARALRHMLPGCAIYVLNGLVPGSAKVHAELGARPVLGALEEVEEWAAFCRGHSGAPAAALHFDTGLTRHGLPLSLAGALRPESELLRGVTCDLVMSHMACADTPDNPLNARQLEAFREIRARFPAVRASLANSAAALGSKANHFDLIRPGIALYGGKCLEDEPALEPVATLEARVLQLREAESGDCVGYGATFQIGTSSRIAILSAGYADGYLRCLGAPGGEKRGAVFAAGVKAPVIGRVSMDLLAADVSEIPAGALKRGDMVELFGRNVLLDEVAEAAGTIGYELLTRLGSRLSRVYTDSSQD